MIFDLGFFMKSTWPITALLLFFTSLAHSATLTIPETFKLLKINNQNYQSSFFETETQVDLSFGRQVLLLRYQDIFDDYDNDDHTKVSSEPFVVIFDMPPYDITVRAPVLADEKEAKQFAQNPEFDFIRASHNGELAKQSNLAKAEVLWLTDFENKQYQAIQLAHSNTATQPLSAKQTLETEKLEGVNALANLKFWWQQASKSQQQAFLIAIKSGTNK